MNNILIRYYIPKNFNVITFSNDTSCYYGFKVCFHVENNTDENRAAKTCLHFKKDLSLIDFQTCERFANCSCGGISP